MNSIWEQFNESAGKIWDKLASWIDSLILALPNIILALIVLLAAIFASKYVTKYFKKLASKLTPNTAVVNLLATIATSVFIMVVLFFVLSILNLSTALTSILAGAGVVGLAVGLALQDPIVNLYSGVMMSFRRYYALGDLIETNNHFGVVDRVTLRATVIKTPQGQEVIIPNKKVYEDAFVNYSTFGMRRVDLECGVSYGEDLEKVKAVSVEAIKTGVQYNDEREVELFYREFGDSSINFVLRFWLRETQQGKFLHAQSEAIIALKKAFDANDIMIPFPIRTLDFGIKGGEKLNEMLSLEKLQNLAEGENGEK